MGPKYSCEFGSKSPLSEQRGVRNTTFVIKYKSTTSYDKEISRTNKSDIFKKVPNISQWMPPEPIRKIIDIAYASFRKESTFLIVCKNSNIDILILTFYEGYFRLQDDFITQIIASSRGHDEHLFLSGVFRDASHTRYFPYSIGFPPGTKSKFDIFEKSIS